MMRTSQSSSKPSHGDDDDDASGITDVESLFDEDDESTRFNENIEIWASNSLKDKQLLRHGFFGNIRKQILDASEVDRFIREMGGHDREWSTKDLCTLGRKLMNAPVEKDDKVMKRWVDPMLQRYVGLLKRFHQSKANEEQAEAHVNGAFGSNVLHTLDAQRMHLTKFLKELQSAKHAIRPEIKEELRHLISILQNARTRIDEASGLDESDYRTILWLGINGVGKTFSLNMLLYLTEKPSWQYGVDDKDDVRDLFDLTNDDDSSDSSSVEKDTGHHDVTRDSLKSVLRSSAGGLPRNIVVKPALGDFGMSNDPDTLPSRNEIECEKEYLLSLKKRAFDYSQWKELSISRGEHFPGYVLTSSSEVSHQSTTLHATHIRAGSKWRFKVEYLSLAEIEEQLRTYDFRLHHPTYAEKSASMDADRRVYHEHMLNFLRATILSTGDDTNSDNDGEEFQASLEMGADLELEDVEDIPDSDLFPKEGAPLKFRSEVECVAGRSFIFCGSGNNSLEDRIYIRRLLHGVLFKGIFSEFDPVPGTVPMNEDMGGGSAAQLSLEDTLKAAPDRLIIKKVTVYAPSILLDGGTEWQDAPGSNDNDPEKHHNLVEALKKCDGLMIFGERTSNRELLELFAKYVTPRIWGQTSNITFGNFHINEKSFNDLAYALARKSVIDQDRIQEIRRDFMKPFFNVIMKNPPEATESGPISDRETVKKRASESLNKATWHVYPLMYASLLTDATSRLSLGIADKKLYNPLDLSKLQDLPNVRKVANDATTVTFGRKLLDSLLRVSQSSTQVILKDVRMAFQTSKIKIQGNSEDRAPLPDPPARVLRNLKHQRQAHKWENTLKDFRTAEDSWYKNEIHSGLGDLTRTDDYMRFVEARMGELVKRFRLENQPLTAADFIDQEKRYHVREIFESAIDKLDFSVVCKEYVTLYSKFCRGFLQRLKIFILGVLSSQDLVTPGKSFEIIMQRSADPKILNSAEYQWLRKHYEIFWESRGEEYVKSWLGLDYKLAVSWFSNQGLDKELRAEWLQEMLDRSDGVIYTLFKKRMPIKWPQGKRAWFRNPSNSNVEKFDWLCEEISNNLRRFGTELKSSIATKINEELLSRIYAAADRLFCQVNRSVAVWTMRNFLKYIENFRAMKSANRDVSVGLTKTIGFISNRLKELRDLGRLGEIDGFWVETWVKTKFILNRFMEKFMEDTPGPTPARGDVRHSARVGEQSRGRMNEIRIKLGKSFEGEVPGNQYVENEGPSAKDYNLPVRSLGMEGDIFKIEDEENECLGVIVKVTENDFTVNVTDRNRTIERRAVSFERQKLRCQPQEFEVEVLEHRYGSKTCVCRYIGASPLDTKEFHSMISKSHPKAVVASLIRAICNVSRIPNILADLKDDLKDSEVINRRLFECCRMMVEAVFPIIDTTTAVNRLPPNADTVIKLFDIGTGSMARASHEVFKYWFQYDLDEFLAKTDKDFKDCDDSRLAAPLLVGACEIFGVPFLVHVGEEAKEYLIEPIFRRGIHGKNHAYLLSWSSESGFSPRTSQTSVHGGQSTTGSARSASGKRMRRDSN